MIGNLAAAAVVKCGLTNRKTDRDDGFIQYEIVTGGRRLKRFKNEAVMASEINFRGGLGAIHFIQKTTEHAKCFAN